MTCLQQKKAMLALALISSGTPHIVITYIRLNAPLWRTHGGDNVFAAVL